MKKNRATGAKQSTPRLETVLLGDLPPHPDQGKYFRSYGAYEYRALKDDIRAQGLKHPIEVLPPANAAGLSGYTIVAGHTRKKILLELGHTESQVLVRHDLRTVTRAEVDRLFLLANVARRQQDRLGQARAAVGLYVLEKEQQGRRVCGNPLRQGELRDRIGQIVGMSGRNLQRYLNVLGGPAEVQDAFTGGRVRLVDAARVVTLPEKDQGRLAGRLRAGEEPRAVFADFFTPKDRRHVKTADAVASLARAIAAAHADLAGRVERVRPGPVRAHESTLRAGKKLIRGLLDALDGSRST